MSVSRVDERPGAIVNRRDVLTAAVGLALPLPSEPPAPRERPWAKRAEELEPTEGWGCDYVAWEEWFKSRCTYDELLDLGLLERIDLYAMMCELIDPPARAARETGE